MSLFKNYVRSLLRNAIRDKYFTLLNMLGLALGITSAILIFIYIQDQLSYDAHNENFERIYRLEGDFFISEKQDLTAITQIPLPVWSLIDHIWKGYFLFSFCFHNSCWLKTR